MRKIIGPLGFFVFFSWIFITFMKPIQDPDTWWHLASGRYMIENRLIPHQDVFSLTCRGAEWINTYWLFEIGFYAIYVLSGFPGLVCCHALCLVIIFLILDRWLNEEQIEWPLRALFLLLILFSNGVVRAIWAYYASLVSLFFICLLAFSLNHWKRHSWDRSIWIWPFLFMLWANMHRGFLIGLIIAGFYVAAALQESKREFQKRTVWLLACFAATFVNPFTYRVYGMIWDDFSLSGQNIIGWSKTKWQNMEIFWFTVFILWVFILKDFFWNKKTEWPLICTFLFLTYLGISHAFSVCYFMVFAIPFIATHIRVLFSDRIVSLYFKKTEIIFQWTITLFFLIAISRTNVQAAIDTSLVPVGAFDLIATYHLKGPIVNDYLFGGYFLWRCAGDPAVFIDGRYPAVKGYQQLFHEFNVAKYGGPQHWAEFTDKYGFQAALVKYPINAPYKSTFEVYFPRQKWALVYWDDIGLLFLRRTPEHADIIQEYEYKEIYPDATDQYLIQRFGQMNEARLKRAEHELFQNILLHPESERTQYLIALFRSYQKHQSFNTQCRVTN